MNAEGPGQANARRGSRNPMVPRSMTNRKDPSQVRPKVKREDPIRAKARREGKDSI